jgi:hypothetical protein
LSGIVRAIRWHHSHKLRIIGRVLLGTAFVLCAFVNTLGLTTPGQAATDAGRALGEFARAGRAYAVQPFTSKATGQAITGLRQRDAAKARWLGNLVAAAAFAAVFHCCWSAAVTNRRSSFGQSDANRLRGPPAALVLST